MYICILTCICTFSYHFTHIGAQIVCAPLTGSGSLTHLAMGLYVSAWGAVGADDCTWTSLVLDCVCCSCRERTLTILVLVCVCCVAL